MSKYMNKQFEKFMVKNLKGKDPYGTNRKAMQVGVIRAERELTLKSLTNEKTRWAKELDDFKVRSVVDTDPEYILAKEIHNEISKAIKSELDVLSELADELV